jgi:hypothetical protein
VCVRVREMGLVLHEPRNSGDKGREGQAHDREASLMATRAGER